jgi:2-polyprenylphenol 6-hydroxylase
VSARGVHDVAVVGAGMVGAALALELAREGFTVAVIEPRPPAAWQPGSEVDLRVVALAPSSIQMFGRLDVWKSIVAARACPYRRMRVWDALAPGELNFDAADSGDPALGYIVENRLIQDVLWQALHDDGRIAIHCPARVTGTESDAQRRTLVLDDGSGLSARLVVAADGAESALRGMVGIQTHNRHYDQRAIVAHVVTERSHEDTAWQRFLPGATVAFLPLTDGRSSVVWSVPGEQCARLLALDDDAFRAELGAAMDFRLGAILQTTPRAAFDLRLMLAQRYLAPRFAVVGDAAHVVHPLAGQGVNLGLRDVQELTRVLVDARAAKRPFAAESELRKYERRRRSDNAISAYAFDSIQRVFGSRAMPLAALRGAALQLVDKVAPLKQMFARHAAGR